MRTSSKVKVSTEKLLEAVKARRAAIVAEHERAVVKYERDCESYHAKVCNALQKVLLAADAGRMPKHRSEYKGYYLLVPVRFAEPCKPTLRTDNIDRLIATLEMASEPTLTISAEDAANYLG